MPCTLAFVRRRLAPACALVIAAAPSSPDIDQSATRKFPVCFSLTLAPAHKHFCPPPCHPRVEDFAVSLRARAHAGPADLQPCRLFSALPKSVLASAAPAASPETSASQPTGRVAPACPTAARCRSHAFPVPANDLLHRRIVPVSRASRACPTTSHRLIPPDFSPTLRPRYHWPSRTHPLVRISHLGHDTHTSPSHPQLYAPRPLALPYCPIVSRAP